MEGNRSILIFNCFLFVFRESFVEFLHKFINSFGVYVYEFDFFQLSIIFISGDVVNYTINHYLSTFLLRKAK